MRSATLARFQEVTSDPGTIDIICHRVAEGETFREICEAWNLPYGLMGKWLNEDDARRAQYDGALALWADAEAQRTLRIADDAEDVAKAKLQVETRLKLAG